jgi:shikimate kinase
MVAIAPGLRRQKAAFLLSPGASRGSFPLLARRKSGIPFDMMRAQNIFIVGPMGAGKSTVGRQLAETLSYTFKDSDQEIQRRTGVDIPTIFEYEGEAGFRARERQVIEALVSEERIVLATGGGVILSAENRQDLAARGVVIYLHCSPEQQYSRTARDRNRPLLDTEDPLARLRELMEEREPLYRQVADMVVSTEKRGTSSVVKEICRRLESEEI